MKNAYFPEKIYNKLFIRCLLLIAILWMTSLWQVAAQQQGSFTQYGFNTLSINPAYAGYSGGGDALDMKLLVREQWIGLEGAPSTQTLSIHAPIRKKNMGVGFQFTHDNAGSTREVSSDFIYAYHLRLSKRKFSGNRFTRDSHLSFGLQVGASYFRNDLSKVSTNARQSGNIDPVFATNDISAVLFNFGLGIYYYSERIYAGISLPRILDNKEGRGGSVQAKHVFFTAGGLVNFSPSLTLKPSILLKIVPGAPVQLDLNGNLLIKKLLWIGVSWRALASVNFIIEYQISQRLRLGYAYDAATTDINQVSNHTHEILINYRIPLGDIKILNPRCF